MTHNRKNRLRVVAVSIVTFLAVAGCGSSDPNGGVAADGKTVVTFWQNEFDSIDNDWYAQRVKDFNASQDKIVVQHEVIPDGAWEQRFKASQAAGTTPDIYTLPYNQVGPKAVNGELAPLTEHIDKKAWDDLLPNVLESVTMKDQQFAYPFYLEPGSMLIYRTDLFEQVGLDPKNPPKTWDELVAAGEKLKETGLVPFQTAGTAEELSWTTWGMQANATGHLVLSDDWSESLANDPGYAKMFQLYQDLYSKKIVAEQPLGTYGDISPLGQEQVAMAANGSWAVSVLLLDYPELIDKLALAPMPSFDGDQTKPTTTLGGWTIGVDGKSKDVKASATAISWMLAEDSAGPESYFESAKYTKFSPRVSVTDNITKNADTSTNPWYSVMANDIVPYQILEATYSFDVSKAFGSQLEEAMRGKDVAKAQADAHAEVQRLIKDLDLPSQRG